MKISPATLVMILVIALLMGCTTTPTPSPAPVASEFKNVQVLPPTMTRPELIATMRTFTRGLGVRCNHCHVVTETTPEEKLDFPSDAKEEKRVARVMIQMANQINGAWMERVEAAEGHAPSASTGQPEQRVWCWTCHRGKVEPESPPAPPAPAK